jgi:hypothetical protein
MSPPAAGPLDGSRKSLVARAAGRGPPTRSVLNRPATTPPQFALRCGRPRGRPTLASLKGPRLLIPTIDRIVKERGVGSIATDASGRCDPPHWGKSPRPPQILRRRYRSGSPRSQRITSSGRLRRPCQRQSPTPRASVPPAARVILPGNRSGSTPHSIILRRFCNLVPEVQCRSRVLLREFWDSGRY